MPIDPNIQVASLRDAMRRKAEANLRNNKIATYFPDKGEYNRFMYAKHLEFFDAGLIYKERLFMAANRVGKAQPNDEPVLTPNGFVPMGSLRVGDQVIGSDGNATEVTAVYPQGIRPIVKMTFSDGSSTRCDTEHLWDFRTTTDGHNGKFRTITASEASDITRAGKRLVLPQRPVVQLDQEQDLPVDPYLLGLLLGDGGYSQQSVFITSADPSIIAYCKDVAPRYGCELGGPYGPYTWWFSTQIKRGGRWVNLLANLLDGMKLRGKTSHHKRIPAAYLLSDVESRTALLQGMMDTDGHCGKEAGSRVYYSVSKELCEDVAWLARSLGMNAKLRPKKGTYKGEPHASWQTYIALSETPIFRLERKKKNERLPAIGRRAVILESVESEGTAECTCIRVANPDHLYITKDFLVTHNSEAGAYESTCHATGIYPHWWKGRRFDTATEGWACGTTGETTRDIVQQKLLGSVGDLGTGMIPAHLIVKTTSRRGGIADALESIQVKHISGKISTIGLKSYQQGRESFEGTARSYIWLDEEPPADIYTECLYRTVTTRGIVFVTFTPLQGMSDVVKGFVEPESDKSENYKWYVQAGWQDVPHIHENEKKALLATTPPYQIDARTKGEPALGSGAIYPIPESEITIPSHAIPGNWPRCFAMDVGWNRTAALWFAREPGTNRIEVYDEHYASMGEPASHAFGIKQRGDWIPGVIDPACQGSSQIDGRRLIDIYRKLGLKVTPAENSVEAGITEVWNLFSAHQLKIHDRCFNFLREFRQYHRDDKGKGVIVKKNDHLMDCFTGDTEVMTDQGPVAISSLVGKSGKVISRSGSVARFHSARLVRRSCRIVKLRFADGSEVRCTPEHLFLTPSGWVEAVDMKGISCYNGVSQWINRNTFGTVLRSLFLEPFKFLKDAAGTCAGSIFSVDPSAYTCAYGKLQTANGSLADTMFTTKITTVPTTGRVIWNYLRNRITCGITNSGTEDRPRNKRSMQPLSGIVAKLARNGTFSITRRTASLCTKESDLLASGVGSDLPQESPGATDSVLTPASQGFVGHLALTISNAFALFAVKLSLSIATKQQRLAQRSALLGCVEIQNAGFQDVYCLTVPGIKAFCLSNGAVVHNCLRYGIISGRPLMRLRPIVERPYQARPILDTSGRDWMV